MQLRLRLAALLLIGLASPAAAGCSIGLSTPGLLKLSSDSQRLGTDVAGGVASLVTISSITNGLNPTSTITIASSSLNTAPPGFNIASADVETAYAATGLLGLPLHSRGFATGSDSFSVTLVLGLVVTIVLDNHVDATGGFRQGTYTSKTQVSCS